MNTLLSLLLVVASGALFEVSELPVADPGASCFLVPGVAGRGEPAVLSGNTLVRYPGADLERATTVELDKGTSAFDVADVDGDDVPELVLVVGEAVRVLPYGGKAGTARTLFEAKTLFSAAATPFPQVIVTWRGGEALLALPREGVLEMRRLDGTVAERYPVGPETRVPVAFNIPFTATPAVPPEVAGPGALELRVSEMRAWQPVTDPEPTADAAPGEAAFRYATQRQAREALDKPAHLWPWIPLAPDGDTRLRALYATEASRLTVVRVQDERATAGGGELHLGPERRYPGQLLGDAGVFPDFNGDGYTDLLLWDAPEPALSVATLTRALATRDWPLRITVHRYDPGRRRFEARAAGAVALRPPVGWFLEQLGKPPVKHLVIADFDGDGLADLGCSPAPRNWQAWCWRESGFGSTPAFTAELDGDIEEVAFEADLGGSGATSIGLRGDGVVYVLRANAATATP